MGIKVDGFGKTEQAGLFSMAKEMLISWVSRPKEQSTGDWLADKLADHIGEGAADIAKNLMDGIERFNENLRQIDETCQSGGTKEEWLQDKIVQFPASDDTERGKYLSAVNTALSIGNTAACKIIQFPGQSVELKEPAEEIEGEDKDWNQLSLKALAHELTGQTILAGVGGGALAAQCDRAEATAGEDIMEEADLSQEPSGSAVDVGFKAVAAGALKVVGDKGLLPFITKKTPLSVISTIACWGMEGVRTAGQVFRGQISVAKAVERMGRVSAAAIGDACVNGVAAKFLTAIPIIGPLVGGALAENITQNANSKISNMVYEGFKKIQPVVTQVAETAYKAVNKVVESVRKIGNKVLEFFGL